MHQTIVDFIAADVKVGNRRMKSEHLINHFYAEKEKESSSAALISEGRGLPKISL